MSSPADIFTKTLSQFHDDTKWGRGSFAGIKQLSNTKVGAVGQQFIEALCDALGIRYELPTDKNGKTVNKSPWDIHDKFCQGENGDFP